MGPPKIPPDGGGGASPGGGAAPDKGTAPAPDQARTSPPNAQEDAPPKSTGETSLSDAIFAPPTASGTAVSATGDAPASSPVTPAASPSHLVVDADTAVFAIGVTATPAPRNGRRTVAPAKATSSKNDHPSKRPPVLTPTAAAPPADGSTRSKSPPTASPPPKPSSGDVDQPNIWSSARETLLGGASQSTNTAVYDDEVRYAKHYAIARRTDYKIMPDGFQRPATPLEDETMMLYRQKKIFLTEPPRVIDEIYPLKVRLALRQLHHDHMMYDLFVQTPAQLKWTARTAKYHFFESLVRLNQQATESPKKHSPPTASSDSRKKSRSRKTGRAPMLEGSSKGIELFSDVYVFTVSADAHLAVLRFTRPELRQKWLNATFKLPFGTVKLRGTSAFAQEDKRDGLDRTAVRQLYALQLLGHPNMPLVDVYEIAAQLGSGLPILDVKPISPTGTRALDQHVWLVRYNSLEAPQNITQVRCVKIKQGDRDLEMGVFLPRTSTRHPCVTCLSTDHFHNRCPHKVRDDEARAPFERLIEIPVTPSVDVAPAASDLAGHRQQMIQLQEAVAPGIPVPTVAPPATQEAAPATTTSGKQSTPPATVQEPVIKKGTQVRALAKAIGVSQVSKDSKRRELVKLLKTRRTTGPNPTPTTAPQQDAPSTEKPKPRPSAKIAKRGKWSVPSPERIVVGEKRPRDTSMNLSAFAAAGVAEETSEPVTRQPKQSEDHQVVDRAQPDPPRVRLEWAPPDGALPPVTKQLTVMSFLKRLSGPTDATEDPTDGPTAGSDDQAVEYVETKPGPSVMTFPDLLAKLNARTVSTVADGRCLYDSLRAAQSRTCGDAVDPTNPTERALTKDLMTDLNLLLAEDLVSLLAIGSLQLRDLCSRYLHEENIASDAVPRLIEYFKTAAAQDAPTVSRHFWGGEAEITAFVSWTGEPVYVFDIWPDDSVFVQRYTPVSQPFADGSTAIKVVRQAPSIERFLAQIAIYRRREVVPLMLALRHSYAKDAHTGAFTHSGHFSAVRIQDAEYRKFVGSARLQHLMKQRLPTVLLEISDLATALSPMIVDSEPSVWSSGTSSEYLPTSAEISPRTTPSFGDSVSAIIASSEGHAAPPARLNDADATATTPAPASPTTTIAQSTMDALGSMAPVSTFDLSQLTATPPDPSLSYDASPPVAVDPTRKSAFLTRTEEASLLEQLLDGPTVPKQQRPLLNKALKANKTAYHTWRARQQKANPLCHRLIAGCSDPTAATVALAQRPGALSAMFRMLPFPEVQLALLPDDALIQAGRAAIVVSRIQMLQRVQQLVKPDMQATLREWAAAINAASDPDMQWHLAQDEGRWKRLQAVIPPSQHRIPQRSQPGLTTMDWCRLVAVVLLVPDCLPHAFVTREIPSRCDALLMWMSHLNIVIDTVAAGSAVARRLWRNALGVFDQWPPTLEGPPTHSTPESKVPAPLQY